MKLLSTMDARSPKPISYDDAPYKAVVSNIKLGGGAGYVEMEEGDTVSREKGRLTAAAKSLGLSIRWRDVEKGARVLRPVVEAPTEAPAALAVVPERKSAAKRTGTEG